MKKRFSFFVKVKSFTTGELNDYDVMPTLYRRIYTSNGRISKNFFIYDEKFNKKSITTKSDLLNFVNSIFMYHYWSKCEYEFIIIDWPYKDDSVSQSRPEKIDVYEQIKPNLNLIVDMLWMSLEEKINKKSLKK